MNPHLTRKLTLLVLALMLAALVVLILPVVAVSGDYGIFTGASRGEETPVPEQTDTPIPPTATPSGARAEGGGDECC